MQTAIIGGTGFVGSYIVDALLERGHEVSLLVRAGSEAKVGEPDRVRMVTGDLSSRDALRECIAGSDAVIYLVGILRAFPARGITFEKTQHDGVVKTTEIARKQGVRRFLLMSANGVDAAITPYQRTKLEAERHVMDSGLDATVFRPSVIFGDPRGRMEFATQLYRDMIRPPLPAVGFHSGWSSGSGAIVMSPVHIEDVATAFVASLEDSSTFGRSYDLGGPETLSWVDILRRVATAVGKNKLILPMPIALMRIGATLFDWLPFFPVTRDQLTMLEQGNTCSPDELYALIGREPRAFVQDNLRYLRPRETA